MKKGGKQWRSKLQLLEINNPAYGALNRSVKNTLLTQKVNASPKSYTKTTNIADQFVEPKSEKRVYAIMQTGVTFMQIGQPTPNNRKSVKVGGDKTSKVEKDKWSDERVREASFGSKKKTCYHCRSDEKLLSKCPQLFCKQKNEIRKHVLQQQKKQQVQVGQVKEFHLHIQLDDSEIAAAAYAQATIDQAEGTGFIFLQKE